MDTRQTSRHFQDFRLADNPRLKIQGFFHEPPVTVNPSPNPPRLLQVSEKVDPSMIVGNMLVSATKIPSRHLVSEFMTAQDNYLFRTYEANKKLTLYRERTDIKDPVTKMPKKDPNPMVQEIWVNVSLVDLGMTGKADNPVGQFHIRSAIEIKERDLIGGYLVKQVVKENGLYFARADYNVRS